MLISVQVAELTSLLPHARFSKMFDRSELPPNLQQLYDRRPARSGFQVQRYLADISDESGEEGKSLPPTPPNTPEPESSKRSKAKRTERTSAPPQTSPSWILRNMRIPSLTSDTSEASGDGEGAFGLRRASTVTQMTQEEVQEAEMEVSSSCTDAEPVATVATDAEPVALHQVDGMDTNVQRQLVTLPRMHWLEVQESRICQRVSTSQVCWSEEVTPRQAGGAAGSLAKVVVRTKR